ncbi:unnamed protein product [Boreogadus saida]
MEVVIRDYRPNKSRKKAVEKREREQLVLALFKEEGERWRSSQRLARQIITKKEEAQPLPLKLEPPPYKPTKMYPLATLYPLLKGNVESKGEDLTRKERDKKRHAGFLEPAAVISQAVQQGAQQTQPPQQAVSPPVQQPQSQWSLTPPFSHTIQIHLHTTGNPTNGNRQYKNNQQQGFQGQFKKNQQQGFRGPRRGPLICYGCNQEGHIKRDCLTNPYPSQQGQANGNQGRQDQGNHNQGQQGPFMGQGY